MCRSKGKRWRIRGASQCRIPRRVSKIGVRQSSKQCSMGKRLMIIELRKYIEVRELLIEKGSTGSQAQVIYRGEDRRVSVTRAAVHMEGKERGGELGTGAHTIGLQVGNENRYAYEHCGAINGALAFNNIEID